MSETTDPLDEYLASPKPVKQSELDEVDEVDSPDLEPVTIHEPKYVPIDMTIRLYPHQSEESALLTLESFLRTIAMGGYVSLYELLAAGIRPVDGTFESLTLDLNELPTVGKIVAIRDGDFDPLGRMKDER